MSSNKRAAKKQKKAEDDEDRRLWTTYEEIPSGPPPIRMVTNEYGITLDKNETRRFEYMEKLSKSLVQAVTTGNIKFVKSVLLSKSKRDDVLAWTKHTPKRSYGDATDVLIERLGIARPVQPFFGLQDLIWGHFVGRLARKNLLIQAIRNNQLEMLQQLLQLGLFDINATNDRGESPLVAAIEQGNREIIHFLLDQPQLYVTHPETRLYRTGNGRSRPRGAPTALSLAASKGQLDIVQLLVNKGALLTSSTSRSDDPYSLEKCRLNDAKELVAFSMNEAIIEAYEQTGRVTSDAFLRRNVPVQTFAGVLELLLTKMGAPQLSNNAICVYIVDKIKRNQWSENSSASMYSYSYHLAEDEDFDRDTGMPANARAIAVARGLRPPSFASTEQLDDETAERSKQLLEEKRQFWSELVMLCQKRLTAAGPEEVWMKAVDAAIKEREDNVANQNPHLYHHYGLRIVEAQRNTQLLFWCRLFAAPWSRERHFYYPEPTRRYVKELAHVGSALDLKHHGNSGFKEVWDREVLPFVIE